MSGVKTRLTRPVSAIGEVVREMTGRCSLEPRASVAEALESRMLLSVQDAALLSDVAAADPNTAAAPAITAASYGTGVVFVKMREHLAQPLATAGTGSGRLSGMPLSLSGLITSLSVQAIEPAFATESVAGPQGIALQAFDGAVVGGNEMAAKRAELSRWYRLTLPADADVAAVASAFAANPAVEYAEPQIEWKAADTTPYPLDLPSVASDPEIDTQWYLADTKTQRAWEYLEAQGLHPGGSHSVVVAVIDTGVDYTHPELAGNIWTNPGEIPGNGIDDDHDGIIDDVHGVSVVSNVASHSGDCMDITGHGTHVAGIIAAQAYNHLGGVGIAFNTQIMAVRAGQYNGTFTTDDIAEGILYAVNHGAEVINMSFGGYARSQIIADALAMALNQAVLVAAAGNDSKNSLVYPFYPAALPFVHGVQSTNSLDQLSWFSNYNYDMSAPGEGIFSTLPGNQYAYWSGTSMAAPVVSGVAALMRSFFWQREVYSSRFLMGAIFASQLTADGEAWINPVDAFRALSDPPPPGLILDSNWLFDNKMISSGNDEDGRVDAGETLQVAVAMTNRSGLAENVAATLRAHAEGAVLDDPYVTMVTSTINYGNIGSFNTSDNGLIYDSKGVVTGVQRPFVFSVDPNCPNDHVIPFELTTTCSNGLDPNDTNVYTRILRFEYIVQRGKNLPSVISQNMELGAQDFWIVGGPVLVEPGATLTIDAGAQVQWGALSTDPYNPGPQTGYIVVRGTLSVLGTADNPANLFPSYLVSGQTTKITVETGGTANLSYVDIRNPYLSGMNIIDHANLTWDAYASKVEAQVITNTAFGKFRGGGTLTAYYGLNTCLFDAGWITPASSRIDNTVFLQDNENNRSLSYTPAASYDSTWVSQGIIWPAYRNGYTYGLMQLPSVDVITAECVAQYFGGHLVSVHSAADETFLQSYYMTHPLGDRNWFNAAIGLLFDPYAGQYRWSDGSPVDYQNWAPGQPANVPAGSRSIVTLHVAGDTGSEFGWRALGYPVGYLAIVRMPGTWTQAQWDAQWNAGIASGSLTQYIRDNHPGYVHNNAILSKYWDPTVTRWMRIVAPGSSTASVAMRGNFWGTTTQQLIDYAIVDYSDNFTTARVDYDTPLADGAATTWPFVEQVLIGGFSADTVPTIGSGPATFTITFNRDMNTSIQPYVTFGPSAPCTDFTVKPIAKGWIDARTWQGSFYMTPVTGEGYQLMRISGAVAADDPWLISGYDVARYRFQVKTMGVASMNLQAVGQEGTIHLSWLQNDYDLLAGYNLYRSDSLNGTYTKINTTIIPPGYEHFDDTNVTPAVPRYYKFTVVTTGMTESNYSNVASAAAIDTIPPVITHTPVTAAPPGSGLRISATLGDNLAVVGGKLCYRLRGSNDPYTALDLINTSGTTWSATIPGSSVAAPGVEYYLTATDCISTTYNGTPAAPHTVIVQNIPTVSSVAPSTGTAVGGQTVTVSGTLFQPGASVLFGGQPASNVNVLSGNQITCTTLPHFPAQVDVKVINPDNSQATLLNGFRYQDQGVVLSLPSASADHGAIIELPITLSNVNGLRGADITVTFTSSVLSATSVRVGPLASGWGLSFNKNTAGQVIISLASATAVSGSGVLAYITFSVPGAAMAQTALNITSASLNSGAITCNLSPGTFTVNGVFNLSGNVNYYTGNGAVRATGLSLVGVGAQSTNTNASGAFSFTGIPTGAYTLTPSKSDDVAQITATDASLVLQAAASLITLTANQKIAADVDRNGTVNSMDASYILEESVGLLTLPFPGSGRVWDFVPGSLDYPLINNNLTAQNFTAILLGDVSGNWQAPTASGFSGGPVSLSMPQVAALPGDHVTLPVQIALNSVDVYAGDLVINYDAANLVLEWVHGAGAAAGMMVAVNGNQPGVIRVGFAGAQPLATDGTLLDLQFVVVGAPTSPAAIDFASAQLDEGATSATLLPGAITVPAPVIYDGKNVTVTWGSHLFNDDLGQNGPIALTVNSRASVVFATAQTLESLTISPNAAVIVSTGVGAIRVTAGLSISGSGSAAGKLDLCDNDLILGYTGSTPIATIRQWLSNGQVGIGPSIITSTASPSIGHATALGLVDNALLHLTAWNGLPLTTAGDFAQLIIKHTYAGDTDLDGKVTQADYLNIFANMGRTGAQWFEGDLNHDGLVTVDDFALVSQNLGVGDNVGPGPLLLAATPAPANAAAATTTRGVPKTVKAVKKSVPGAHKAAAKRKAAVATAKAIKRKQPAAQPTHGKS